MVISSLTQMSCSMKIIICNNKSAITATWKDENISIFDKTKPDADVAKVARNAIAALQPFSTIKSFCVQGHADKGGPPFLPQE
jgi:septin family protein